MRIAKWTILAGGLLLCLSPLSLRAQGIGASGDLKGTVTDPSGAGIPAATIKLVDVARGLNRIATANDQGGYTFAGIQPATYDVHAEHAGFQKQVKKGLVVAVGQTTIADFTLKVSAVFSEVTVMGETPIVETERTQQSNLIGENYIRELPIDRRDYLSFTLLAPGVADSKALADNTDFRVAQTPQSGLSFYGSNGRGNNVTVDGFEADDDAGGVRPTVSQDAVQEFQIDRSNYSAEFGGASGGVINIVTKSGTNEMHGNLYGYIRDEVFDARNPFASVPPPLTFVTLLLGAKATPVRPNSNRQQFGGTIGFPIRTDKTFAFIAYEGFRRNESASVPVLTDTSVFSPTAPQNAILTALPGSSAPQVPCISNPAPNPPTMLDPATCATVLGRFLTVNPFLPSLPGFSQVSEPYILSLFSRDSGIFPFTGRNDQFSVRLDHQLSESNRVFFRYNFNDGHERNASLGGQVGFSRGNLIKTFDSTAALAWYHQFQPQFQNEVRLQWVDNSFKVIPNEPIRPGINIAGFGFFGRDIFLPNFTALRHYTLGDDMARGGGRHRMKWGGGVILRGNRSESHTFFPGRFNFGDLAPPASGLLSPCLAAPAACGLSGVAPASLSALQAVKLGLPQFYQQGFGDPVVSSVLPLYSAYWQDTFALRPNLTLNFGVRYDLDQRRAPLNTDKDNLAPRLGFAWDPFKDKKSVVRGSFGIFTSPIYYQVDDVVQSLGVVNGFRQIPQLFVPLTGVPGLPPILNAGAIFQVLLSTGVINCTATTGDACITPALLAPFGINITQTGPIPPLSAIFSGAPDYQNPSSQQASFGIERQITPNLSVSADYIHVHTIHITRARDKNVRPAPIGSLGIPNYGLCPGGCFINPLLLQDNIYESTGNARYDGFILSANQRFSHSLSLFASYTLSKAIDEVTDYNSDFEPNDNLNLRAEKAASPFDERHKLVIAGVLQSALQGGPGSGVFANALSGWTLSPIVRANSSRPFNLLAGADVNGDRHSTTDRPPFAGRDTGVGPNFWTFDVRLMRRIGFGEKHNFELTAEAFNLFNRTNFASVNNTVGIIPGPFNLTGRTDRTPSQPLGFTSASDPRRLQFGVRIIF